MGELQVFVVVGGSQLYSGSTIEAHQRKIARFDATMFLSPEDLTTRGEYPARVDRQIIEAERRKGSSLVEKLYGDTATDRAVDAIPNHLVMSPNDKRLST